MPPLRCVCERHLNGPSATGVRTFPAHAQTLYGTPHSASALREHLRPPGLQILFRLKRMYTVSALKRFSILRSPTEFELRLNGLQNKAFAPMAWISLKIV